ncbi:GGDEF domain-containing protein [Roseomonas sp. HJA6]|uniref:diguanylate cyclase n=1 Tax=Roseomonas alba TaxID=2846776 RepID=A0ABS7ACF9_9PROT|nr:GGDEF domain-containing protein [Neoroseomonas alba]MBW6399437.1 GGDEF domain-containing protein [Neoroseomonas alba]
MPSDVVLHFAFRAATAVLALAAFGFGAWRALAMPMRGLRRALRLFGALVLLSVAALAGVDAVAVSLDGKAPESMLLDWLWVGLDMLVPAFFLLLIEGWRRHDRLEAQLAALSLTDPLTGLANRRGFLARALPAIAVTRRNGGDCAVVVIDLDRFKAINDSFGHAAGDAVLCGVAGIIAEAVRGADVVGRLGGEEFALLLPGADAASAALAAERLRGLVAVGVPHPGGERVTMSAGVATLGTEEESEAALDAALRAADGALYAAKRGGRDQVRVDGEGRRSIAMSA